MPHESSWTCPNCERRVPASVEECYCGVKRSQVAGSPANSGSDTATWWSGPWALVGWAAVAAALVLWAAREQTPRREATPAPTLSAALAPAGPRPAATVASPPAIAPSETFSASPAPSSGPEPSPPDGEEAAAAAPSTPASDAGRADDLREQGARAFDAALAGLSRKGADLESNSRMYAEQCGGSTFVSGCTSLRGEVERLLGEVRTGLEQAEDEARRAWVYPGVLREIRRKHRLDEESWGRLESSVRASLAN